MDFYPHFHTLHHICKLCTPYPLIDSTFINMTLKFQNKMISQFRVTLKTTLRVQKCPKLQCLFWLEPVLDFLSFWDTAAIYHIFKCLALLWSGLQIMDIFGTMTVPISVPVFQLMNRIYLLTKKCIKLDITPYTRRPFYKPAYRKILNISPPNISLPEYKPPRI